MKGEAVRAVNADQVTGHRDSIAALNPAPPACAERVFLGCASFSALCPGSPGIPEVPRLEALEQNKPIAGSGTSSGCHSYLCSAFIKIHCALQKRN